MNVPIRIFRTPTLLISGCILLGGCGLGVCVNQATCPDGSWSIPATDGTGSGSGSGSGSSSIVGTFADFMPSLIHRDKGGSQMTLKQELAGDVFAGYRRVPKIGNTALTIRGDDDGYTAGAVTYGTRPTLVCGTTQPTIAARIAHCDSVNGSVAKWDGTINGNAGQGIWKLVTYNGTHEVWREEATSFLWSDNLGQTNWCRASGSSGGGPYAEDDPDNTCDVGANQDQTTPESWCAEHASFNTPALYDSMKGGMRQTATGTSPSVIWRLPSRGDWYFAELMGIRFVIPRLEDPPAFAWTSTIYSPNRATAWTMNGYTGFANSGTRSTTANVRCIGFASQ